MISDVILRDSSLISHKGLIPHVWCAPRDSTLIDVLCNFSYNCQALKPKSAYEDSRACVRLFPRLERTSCWKKAVRESKQVNNRTVGIPSDLSVNEELVHIIYNDGTEKHS